MSKCYSCKLRYVCEESAEWECTHHGYRDYMPEDSVEYSSNAVEKVIEAWNRRADNEYIERGAALREAKYAAVRGLDPVAFVEDVPVADVAPVVHARWLDAPWLYYGAKQYVCSRCRKDEYWKKRDLHYKEPYCPNCGAKMDGGNSDG